MIIYSKYILTFSVFEVIYFIFLSYSFSAIHSFFLTYKGHIRDTPNLGDVLRKSWGRPESTSQERPLDVRLGRPLGVISKRPQDVRSGRPEDDSSGRPWDGQIRSLGGVLGTLDEEVLGTSEGPIFAGWEISGLLFFLSKCVMWGCVNSTYHFYPFIIVSVIKNTLRTCKSE